MSSSPPLVVADRYRLVAPLGQGGMGRVWRATDVVLHREVAIKELVPPPGLTEEERREMRDRSLREARAIARLNNVNVVRVFDVLRTDADPWIVMEYVPSRSLQDILAADGPFPAIRAAEIGLGVLGALRAAHRAGVVHRDVKPGNVLIGEDGRVVLTDFGLATVPGDPNVTRTGLVLGSPAYIAPERARDGTAGPGADLWSLGATLYAAVEGASPFARSSAIATLAALATENPPPSRNAGPLKPVLNGLLRKDPTHRINADEAERLLLRATGKRSRLTFPMSPTMRRPGIGRERPALPGAEKPSGSAPVVPGPRPPATPPAATPPASRPPVAPAAEALPVFAPGKATVGRRPADAPTRIDGPPVPDPVKLDATRLDTPAVKDNPVFGTGPAKSRGKQQPDGPSTPPALDATMRGSDADLEALTADEVAAHRKRTPSARTATPAAPTPAGKTPSTPAAATPAEAAQAPAEADRAITVPAARPKRTPAEAQEAERADEATPAEATQVEATQVEATQVEATQAGTTAADEAPAETDEAGKAADPTPVATTATDEAPPTTIDAETAAPESTPPTPDQAASDQAVATEPSTDDSADDKPATAKAAPAQSTPTPEESGADQATTKAATTKATPSQRKSRAAAATAAAAAAAREEDASPADEPVQQDPAPTATNDDATVVSAEPPATPPRPAPKKTRIPAKNVEPQAATAPDRKTATTAIPAAKPKPDPTARQATATAAAAAVPVGSTRPAWQPMPIAPSQPKGITVFGTTLTRRQTIIAGVILLVVILALALIIPRAFGDDDKKPGAAPVASTQPAATTPATTPPTTAPTSAAPTSPAPSSAPPSSPAAAKLPAGWHIYHDKETGFSVPVPASWDVYKQGTETYFRENGGGYRLMIVDQTRTPASNPVADWTSQEAKRKGNYADYHRVAIKSVDYWDKAADWEFTYDSDRGNPQHQVKRGFITARDQAYGISWITSANDWNANKSNLQLIYDEFVPARS